MKSIKFKNTTSQRIYDNYMRRLKRTVSTLNKVDSEEVLLEFNSHIFEATQLSKDTSEEDLLFNVLDKLGVPEEVLKPLIADKKLAEATKTLNPIRIFKALILNIKNGISYIIFTILYLSLFGFIYSIILKILNPNEVGLWFKNGSFENLGGYKGISENDGVVEVLGNWFIPVMMACIIVLFIIITLLLRLKQRMKK